MSVVPVAVLLGVGCVVFELAMRKARPLAFDVGGPLVVVGFFAWLMLYSAMGR